MWEGYFYSFFCLLVYPRSNGKVFPENGKEKLKFLTPIWRKTKRVLFIGEVVKKDLKGYDLVPTKEEEDLLIVYFFKLSFGEGLLNLNGHC